MRPCPTWLSASDRTLGRSSVRDRQLVRAPGRLPLPTERETLIIAQLTSSYC